MNPNEQMKTVDVDKIFAVASQQFESTSASNERFEKPSFADIRDLTLALEEFVATRG